MKQILGTRDVTFWTGFKQPMIQLVTRHFPLQLNSTKDPPPPPISIHQIMLEKNEKRLQVFMQIVRCFCPLSDFSQNCTKSIKISTPRKN
jgi:hypothetical protein